MGSCKGVLKITYFIITITSLLIGYYLGSRDFKQDIDDTSSAATEILGRGKRLISSSDDVGIVTRPTAKQIKTWNENPKKKESKEAISEAFANDPELMEIKRKKEFIESTNGAN